MGCLQLQVVFRKRATKFRALLLKITYKDKASYGSSRPCTFDAYTSCVCERVCQGMCVCGGVCSSVSVWLGKWRVHSHLVSILTAAHIANISAYPDMFFF